MTAITVSAPGKLFLAGEWAVLEAGCPAIVAGVDTRVTVRLTEDPERAFRFTLEDFGIRDLVAKLEDGRLRFESPISPKEKKQLRFLASAMETAFEYLGFPLSFALESWGRSLVLDTEDGPKKLGFGSSAASTVASTCAILELAGEDTGTPEGRERLFRLAAIAHSRAQGNVGSAGDVAASVHGGVVLYERFDPAILEGTAGSPVAKIVERPWPGLRVEPLPVPEGLRLLAGWTRGSSSTPSMIRRMNAWREANRTEHGRRMEEIASVVRSLVLAWRAGDSALILDLLRLNGECLEALGDASGVPIETEALRVLRKAANQSGGAGKVSGAGGADIGVGVCFDAETEKAILEAWRESGLIEPVPVRIDPDGARRS